MSTIEYTLSNKFKSYRSVIYNMAYYGISLVLLFSGISKVINPQPMMETIKAVINISEELQITAATFLPIAEIMLGMLLLFKIKIRETLIAVTALFIFFFLFSIYGLARHFAGRNSNWFE